jgi:hypothetical protein
MKFKSWTEPEKRTNTASEKSDDGRNHPMSQLKAVGWMVAPVAENPAKRGIAKTLASVTCSG